jgi:hypothetical protein
MIFYRFLNLKKYKYDATTAVGRFSTAVNIEVWSIFYEY